MLRPESKSRNRSLRVELLESRWLLSAPQGAGDLDTSEYMLGDVLVSVVLFESTGVIDPNTENWTTAEINTIKGETQEALDYWTGTLENNFPGMPLDFHVDWTHADSPVPTKYEPITRRSYNEEGLWIDEFLTLVGYNTSADKFADMRAWNDAQRDANDCDWAITAFVVDSSADEDGSFSDGWFAYSWEGGPWCTLTYDNASWGVEDFGQLLAHEMGHSFYALDEYRYSNDYDDYSGYYNTRNLNAYDGNPDRSLRVNSIMAEASKMTPAFTARVSSPSSLAMIGWQDSDGDGIVDVVDVDHTFTGAVSYASATNALTISGSSHVNALPNLNPRSDTNNAITINTIDALQYRIDGAAWMRLANASGEGDSEIDAVLPLPDHSAHVIEFRTICDRTGATSNVITFEHEGATAPDLVATTGGGSFTPSGVQAREAFSAGIEVRNDGYGPSGAFFVDFYASTDATISGDDAWLGRVEIDDIAVGGSAIAALDLNTFPVLAEGAYYVGCLLDRDGQVEEMNESNNAVVVSNSLFTVTVDPTAAAIGGVVWDDVDDDGVMDAGEAPSAYWTVFLDLDGDTLIDLDEPTTRTDAEGAYVFGGLNVGESYTVRRMLPSDWMPTSPAIDSPRVVTPTASGMTGGVDFGAIEIPRSATITVTTAEDELEDNGLTSLREAVLSAAVSPGVDVIDATGLPTGSVISLVLGEISLDSDVVIMASDLTIDAGGASRVFTQDGASIRTVLSGLTLMNGSSPTNGGAMLVSEGWVRLDGVAFVDGRAAIGGGGLAVTAGARVELADCTFTNNIVDSVGGAMLVESADTSVLASDTRFEANSASDGGAIFATGGAKVVFDSAVMIANEAIGSGGAVQALGADTFVGIVAERRGVGDGDATRSILLDNRAALFGGGIHAVADALVEVESADISGAGVKDAGLESALIGGALAAYQNGRIIANDTMLQDHTAAIGGAVFAAAGGSSAELTGSHVQDNQARLGGGMILLQGATGRLTSSDVEHNVARRGGGVYLDGAGTVLRTTDGSRLLDNQAETLGGGVYVGEEGRFESNDTLIGGETLSASGERNAIAGGGIAVERGGAADLTDTEIVGHSAVYGAGLIVRGFNRTGDTASTVTMLRCEVRDNAALVHGGGVYVAAGGQLLDEAGRFAFNSAVRRGGGVGALGAETTVRLSGSIVEGNVATNGGGMSLLPGVTAWLLDESLITLNTASGRGGGVAIEIGATCFADASAEIVANVSDDVHGAVIPYEAPAPLFDLAFAEWDTEP